MNGLSLLTADMRRAEKRGPKILIVGIVWRRQDLALGHTSRRRRWARPCSSTLRPETLRSPACRSPPFARAPGPRFATSPPRSAAPIAALPANAAYSQAHFDAVVANPAMAELTRYSIVFVDSLTEISRICRAWAELQPESVIRPRQKGPARNLRARSARTDRLLQQMQHARAKTVVFVSVLEKVTDDFGASHWGIQLEGQRTGRELPAIVDEVITMHFVDFGDGKPVRAFVCTAPNALGLPGQGPIRKARAIRGAAFGQAPRETDPAQSVRSDRRVRMLDFSGYSTTT